MVDDAFLASLGDEERRAYRRILRREQERVAERRVLDKIQAVSAPCAVIVVQGDEVVWPPLPQAKRRT